MKLTKRNPLIKKSRLVVFVAEPEIAKMIVALQRVLCCSTTKGLIQLLILDGSLALSRLNTKFFPEMFQKAAIRKLKRLTEKYRTLQSLSCRKSTNHISNRLAKLLKK